MTDTVDGVIAVLWEMSTPQRDFIREALRKMDVCTAVAWGGPGHQSRRQCQVNGEHDVHADGEDEWESNDDGSPVYLGYH